MRPPKRPMMPLVRCAALAAFALAASIAALTGVAATAGAQSQTKTLDAVRQRGQLACGVSTGLPGFSAADEKGVWTGLDVDYCRAIAAAVLGDAGKVRYVPTTTKERFEALRSGEIDVLARGTTWTIDRDSKQGLAFIGINYYDGQGFMVKKAAGIDAAKKLDGATICMQTGTTTELNLADFFRTNKIQYKTLVFDKLGEVLRAYQADRCDAFSTDASALYVARLQMANPDEHVVLPDIISKEPFAPVVRQGDFQWFTIAKWVHFALLNAEELGVTQANAEEMLSSSNPDIRRLLGKEGDFGKGLGLDNDWALRIVKQVGNYGEIFERNVGAGSRLKIERGLNRLWSKGGLQYAPPIR